MFFANSGEADPGLAEQTNHMAASTLRAAGSMLEAIASLEESAGRLRSADFGPDAAKDFRKAADFYSHLSARATDRPIRLSPSEFRLAMGGRFPGMPWRGYNPARLFSDLSSALSHISTLMANARYDDSSEGLRGRVFGMMRAWEQAMGTARILSVIMKGHTVFPGSSRSL